MSGIQMNLVLGCPYSDGYCIPVTGNGCNILVVGIPCDSVDPSFVFTQNFDLLVLSRVEDDGRVVGRARDQKRGAG